MNRLDAIKARLERATEAPWFFTGSHTAPIPAVIEAESAHYSNDYEPGVYLEPMDAEFIAHARTDVPALVTAVEAVSLHVPEADTTGNVYCVVRGADYYTDCPTFKSGDTWPDHIANVVARALGEES